MNSANTLQPELDAELERYELRASPRYQFGPALDLERRDFLRLVGGGIVVCLLVSREAASQDRGRGGRGGGGPQEIGAWLHISEAGEVTVYTGKVEVGQNIRTSLSQAVADELRPLVARRRTPLSRNEILQAHARHEAMQQLQTPAKLYRELLAVVYKRLAEEWGVPAPWDECLAYGRSIGNWPAFPDSADALNALKRHFKLVILSNVDNASFALSNKRLEIEADLRDFEARLRAEEEGVRAGEEETVAAEDSRQVSAG